MAALVFPPSPSLNDTFEGPYGEVYTWDGTRWTLTADTGGGGPVDLTGTAVAIAFSFPNIRTEDMSATIAITMPLTIPAQLVGSYGLCVVGSTGNLSCTLQKYSVVGGALTNFAQIGFIGFAAGAFSATVFTLGGPYSLLPGDILQLLIPADATQNSTGITIAATRA